MAHAKLFKAMAIGALAQHYEQVGVQTNPENSATFVPRLEAYNIAVGLLGEAKSAISSTAVSSEFTEAVTLGNIDLSNSIDALSARYNLFAGNYEEAITNAQSVSQTEVSNFVYDLQNLNPIWSRVFLNDSPTLSLGITSGCLQNLFLRKRTVA
ncbi:hypothetical protein Q2T40_03955 [Winogradskyella maritima]|nr:hypothetical protein [Winogradskyella maritima]